MVRKILLPLDGSVLSERAIPFARALAKACAAELILVRAAETRWQPGMSSASAQIAGLREAEDGLAEIERRLYPEGLSLTRCAWFGDPDWVICDEADMRAVDLIVMSTHGRGGLGRWIYGSVADRVLRRSSVPVLLVPATCITPWLGSQPSQVLVPVDTSPFSEQAVAPGIELARALEASLLLVHVSEPPRLTYGYGEVYTAVTFQPEEANETGEAYLQTLASRFSDKGIAIKTRSKAGSAAETIASIAATESVVAIAMASHGRGGVERLAIGSVATGVIQRSPVPILITRPSLPHKVKAAAAPGLALDAAELDLLRRGLNALLTSAEHDRQLAGRIRRLTERIAHVAPGPVAERRRTS